MKLKRAQLNHSERGITLVVLVITITIMIILAGVTINYTINKDDLIGKAEDVRNQMNNRMESEQAKIDAFWGTQLPSPPTGIKKVGYTSTTLSVKAQGDKNGYKYSIDGTNWSSTIPYGTAYEITGLTDGQTYTIYAKSVNSQGSSSPITAQLKVGYDAMLKLCSSEASANSPFLGNSTVTRNKIESVTITDSITGHSVSDANCWDASAEGNGKILAWYEDADNDGNYEVTIGQEGGVIANTNSEILFAYIGNSIEGTTINGLENLDTSNVTSMYEMFYYCKKVTSLDVSNFYTSKVTTMGNMFNSCESLASINVSNFDTRVVEKMFGMFQGCRNLTNLDLSHFNTNKAEHMDFMFYACANLIQLNINNFDTSNVKAMDYMFGGCSKLTQLDLSHFNTSNVEEMDCMFIGCSKLTQLDLSHFNTSNVDDMKYMFSGCSQLTQLDISSFNTSNVNDMKYMFSGCSMLTQLDISSFNTSNVSNMKVMFSYCSNLTKIYAGAGWNTGSVTDSTSMFDNCTSLSGDIPFNSSYIDKTYATTTGGYLTYKAAPTP